MKNEMPRQEKDTEEKRIKELKAIIEGSYPEEALAKVGVNRGQYFVRIPRVISKRLGLQREDQLLFKVHNENKEPKLTVEKVKK